MWLFESFFSSILQPWYVEVRISRSISESPLEFEITRVDCICIMWISPSKALKNSFEDFFSLLWIENKTRVAVPVQKMCVNVCITKTCLFKYIEHFTTENWKFSLKKIWYFHISAENIDRGNSLEPPHWGGSNEYLQSVFLSRNKQNNVYPCKPQFYYIEVGFKGVNII